MAFVAMSQRKEFSKITWFLHECHIAMCMEGNYSFSDIVTLHEQLYKYTLFLEGYINFCLYLRFILCYQEVCAWVERNVIEYCHNFRGKKEEDDLKKISHCNI